MVIVTAGPKIGSSTTSHINSNAIGPASCEQKDKQHRDDERKPR
jgi:hypothetical protein